VLRAAVLDAVGADRPAGVVDQAVQRPAGPDGGDQRGEVVLDGEVGGDHGAAGLAGQVGEPVGAAGGGDDIPPVGPQAAHGGRADPARGAGDERATDSGGVFLGHVPMVPGPGGPPAAILWRFAKRQREEVWRSGSSERAPWPVPSSAASPPPGWSRARRSSSTTSTTTSPRRWPTPSGHASRRPRRRSSAGARSSSS